jgi:hypothetical protein
MVLMSKAAMIRRLALRPPLENIYCLQEAEMSTGGHNLVINLFSHPPPLFSR